MLLGIDPLLNADILYILRAMGHGDELVIVDANFPLESSAQQYVRADGVDAATMLRAVLGVLPIDSFGEDPLVSMAPVHDPDDEVPALRYLRKVIAEVDGGKWSLALIERFAFYERTREAFAVIGTGERRFYGNILIRKGVIAPDIQD